MRKSIGFEFHLSFKFKRAPVQNKRQVKILTKKSTEKNIHIIRIERIKRTKSIRFHFQIYQIYDKIIQMYKSTGIEKSWNGKGYHQIE